MYVNNILRKSDVMQCRHLLKQLERYTKKLRREFSTYQMRYLLLLCVVVLLCSVNMVILSLLAYTTVFSYVFHICWYYIVFHIYCSQYHSYSLHMWFIACLVKRNGFLLHSHMESRLVMEVEQELDRQEEMPKEAKVVVVAVDKIVKMIRKLLIS